MGCGGSREPGAYRVLNAFPTSLALSNWSSCQLRFRNTSGGARGYVNRGISICWDDNKDAKRRVKKARRFSRQLAEIYSSQACEKPCSWAMLVTRPTPSLQVQETRGWTFLHKKRVARRERGTSSLKERVEREPRDGEPFFLRGGPLWAFLRLLWIAHYWC